MGTKKLSRGNNLAIIFIPIIGEQNMYPVFLLQKYLFPSTGEHQKNISRHAVEISQIDVKIAAFLPINASLKKHDCVNISKHFKSH